MSFAQSLRMNSAICQVSTGDSRDGFTELDKVGFSFSATSSENVTTLRLFLSGSSSGMRPTSTLIHSCWLGLRNTKPIDFQSKSRDKPWQRGCWCKWMPKHARFTKIYGRSFTDKQQISHKPRKIHSR